MAKGAGQKQKLLVLLHILREESDENHPLSTPELVAALARHGIAAERKSLYDDMEALRQLGYDILVVRGRANSYYLGEREFQLPELKLLVDAVQSAKFITEGKSRKLIARLAAFVSRHDANLLRRQVVVQGRAKTPNEQVLYNVDALHSAMVQNRMISCRYFEWAVDRQAPRLIARRFRHDGAPYRLSPFSLLWDDENYYLIAYDGEAAMPKHYRVDKLEGIQLLDAPREGADLFAELDMATYAKRTFGMFGGEERDVRLRFANHLIGAAVDRFGQDLFITPDGDSHFTFAIKAVVSPQFFGWLLGFGNEAELLAPADVRAQLASVLAGVQRLYDAQPTP